MKNRSFSSLLYFSFFILLIPFQCQAQVQPTYSFDIAKERATGRNLGIYKQIESMLEYQLSEEQKREMRYASKDVVVARRETHSKFIKSLSEILRIEEPSLRQICPYVIQKDTHFLSNTIPEIEEFIGEKLTRRELIYIGDALKIRSDAIDTANEDFAYRLSQITGLDTNELLPLIYENMVEIK